MAEHIAAVPAPEEPPIYETLLESYGDAFAAQLLAESDTSATTRLESYTANIADHLNYVQLATCVERECLDPPEDYEPLTAQATLLLDTRRDLLAGRMFTSEEVQKLEDQLAEYTSQWQTANLLLPEPAEHLTPAEAQRVYDLVERTVSEDGQMFAAATQIYSHYYNGGSEVGKSLTQNKLVRTALVELVAGRPPVAGEIQHQLSPHLFLAVGARLNGQKENFSPYYMETDTNSDTYRRYTEIAQALDAQAIISQVPIQNVEGLSKYLSDGAYLDEIIKGYLETKVPPIAVQSIEAIRFADNLEASSTPEFGEPLAEVRYDTDDKATINISVQSLDAIVAHKSGPAPVIALYMITKVLIHEISHVWHHKLPVAALMRWEAATTDESVHFSDYDRRAFELDLPRKYGERFCEASWLFIGNPYALSVLSESAFGAMERLYAEYVPDYETVLKPAIYRSMELKREEVAGMGMSEGDYRAKLIEDQQLAAAAQKPAPA